MNEDQNTVTPEDFRELTELHDMAAHACELLKAMANEWRLMILCQLSEGEKTVSELQTLLGETRYIFVLPGANDKDWNLSQEPEFHLAIPLPLWFEVT